MLAKTRRGELKIAQAAMSESVQREPHRQAVPLAQGDARPVKEWLGSDHPTLRVFTACGCSLGRESVDKHGGAREFESQLGRGAAFRVLLPASHDKGTHAKESKSSSGGR